MLLSTKKKDTSSSSTTTTEKGNNLSCESTTTLDIPSVSRYSVNYSESTMRGLFFIVRGQYCKKGKAVEVDGNTVYVGGYDPIDTTNPEWYIVLDRVVFHCIYCGSDLNKAKHSIKQVIERYKDTPKKYFKAVSTYTSEDFYEVHYLHKRPLGANELSKKAAGRCPRVSPSMWLHYMCVYYTYGLHYSSIVEEAEENAMSLIKDKKNPVLRNGKRMRRLKKKESLTFI